MLDDAPPVDAAKALTRETGSRTDAAETGCAARFFVSGGRRSPGCPLGAVEEEEP